ncbi:hypothetical protein DFQ27_004782 [Actinomortierella ambigua]|uniref:AB hydrolase-1 domain-containing protein n=1 Tax=Actinomortierella ambigua TaxID=1343610 RepID=A0A9P6U3X7_9FUNG|nr:hypothetical protein DFQ27_004782 [Actinomortierella ambigua]
MTPRAVATAAVAAWAFRTLVSRQRDAPLPSLRHAPREITSNSAYPEDYYPGGQYVTLPQGEMHYFLFGPVDSDIKIVFVHGLSTPASVYSNIARHMAESGCQVLLFDLYSRGYSVGPLVDHNPELYVDQLKGLLQHVGWTRCNIVGLSLGGAISACFAHAHPEVVASLTLIAPGGVLVPAEIPLVGKIFGYLPYSEDILSHKAFRGYFSKRNVDSMKDEFKEHDQVPPVIEEAAQILELQFRHHEGYARGLMSTLRKVPLTALHEQFRSSYEQAYQVQVIWGTRDTVVPESTVKTLQQLIPSIKVTRVEGATHSITMTHPDKVIEQLQGFVIA